MHRRACRRPRRGLHASRELSDWSARFAHCLADRGVGPGDRVAHHARAVAALLRGAVRRDEARAPSPCRSSRCSVPTACACASTTARRGCCSTNAEKARHRRRHRRARDVVVADDAFLAALATLSRRASRPTRAADDLAVFQYTSGTTRELPTAVKHTHRAHRHADDRGALRHRHPARRPLLLPVVAGVGPRPVARHARRRSRSASPSAPIAGKFDAGAPAARRSQRARDHQPLGGGHALPDDERARAPRRAIATRSASSPSPASRSTARPRPSSRRPSARPVCSMYGTTEIGVILVNYPGRAGLRRQAGLARQAGARRTRRGAATRTARPARPASRARSRSGAATAGSPTKDLGRIDEDGYFYHGGRADDVIISAGWTMSAVEIEDAMLKHPDVREAAAIGVPDPLRGQVVKAFVVTPARGRRRLRARAAGPRARTRLSQHEYPRQVEFVAELPKTPAGKVNRKVLREREAGASDHQRPRRNKPCATPRPSSSSPRSPTRASTTCAGASACRSTRHARAVVPRGHARQHPPLRARHRRRQPAVVRSRLRGASTRYGGIIALPSFLFATQPHHLRLRRRPARACTPCGRAPTGPGTSRSRRNDEITTEAWLKDLIEHETRFAGRAVQQIYHVDFFNQQRRAGRRGRQLVLPHRARPRARAGHQVQGGEEPRRRAATPTRSWPRSTSSTRTRRSAAPRRATGRT